MGILAVALENHSICDYEYALEPISEALIQPLPKAIRRSPCGSLGIEPYSSVMKNLHDPPRGRVTAHQTFTLPLTRGGATILADQQLVVNPRDRVK